MSNYPWNGPDILVEPKFTKGDTVHIKGSDWIGTIHSCEKRNPHYDVFLYRVDLQETAGFFYENELENA